MQLTTSKALTLIAGLLLSSAAPARRHQPVEAAQDADTRAQRAVATMTPEEKRVLLISFVPFFLPRDQQPAAIGEGYFAGVPRLNIPGVVESDASLGIASQGGVVRGSDVATALPSGALMASTWDPDLIERAGAAIGNETRAKGIGILLAGGVNLVREPRNGRNFEYLGEDPLLAGRIGGHAIRGIQSNQVIATIKHFALNAQETGRSVLDAQLAEQAMRESDLLAFEVGIEIGKPGAVMCAYNQVNGVYACESRFLLNDVLRRDWGYKGFVMSDWGAVHSTSIESGLDQESGTKPADSNWFGTKLADALRNGQVGESDVDRSARRVLRSMYAGGLIDHPVRPNQPIDYEAHAQVARQVAEAGIVLLKNDGGILPIARSARRIVVVGGHADVGVLGGGGSSQVNPVGGASLALPIAGEPIYHKRMYMPSSPLAALRKRFPGATIEYDDGSDPGRAAAAARGADLVLVFAEQFTAEGKDVPDLSLPDRQNGLIDAVAASNPNVAVVLETGGPVLMPWLARTRAVVEAWYPGQRGGEAIARVLSGDVDASGRLAITFPASLDQLPDPELAGRALVATRTDKEIEALPDAEKHFPVPYREGADVGYRWYERSGSRPLFAFGHGLSYTQFAYDGLALSGGKTIGATFSVVNTGARPGVEVAQVYAQVNGAKRLIGWQRLALGPGERRTVSVSADPRFLASFDVAGRAWVIEPSETSVEVGSASDDPRLTGTIRLAASRIAP